MELPDRPAPRPGRCARHRPDLIQNTDDAYHGIAFHVGEGSRNLGPG